MATFLACAGTVSWRRRVCFVSVFYGHDGFSYHVEYEYDTSTRVEGLVIEHMQVPFLVTQGRYLLAQVLAYVQSLTPPP